MPLSSLLLLLLAYSTSLALAATSTSTTSTTSINTEPLAVPTPAASGALPGPGALGYTYAGCYNETTNLPNTGGARAISGGTMTNNTQTTLTCLTYCSSMSYQYCGIEYGRECWGGRYLSSVSAKLRDVDCTVGCAGNNSQVCGGALTITLFNATAASGTTSAAAPGLKEAAGALGAVVLACVLGAAFSVF